MVASTPLRDADGARRIVAAPLGRSRSAFAVTLGFCFRTPSFADELRGLLSGQLVRPLGNLLTDGSVQPALHVLSEVPERIFAVLERLVRTVSSSRAVG